MPRAYGVIDLDEDSAALWLQVINIDPVRWSRDRFRQAAYLLGRLAASPRVASLGALGKDDVIRSYAHGRLSHQVLPALRGGNLWQHPLLVQSFDADLTARLLAAADMLRAVIDELLVSPDTDAFVVIDFGFWCRAPLGFDLGQLLLGEVQMGERSAAELSVLEDVCLSAYLSGLDAEG